LPVIVVSSAGSLKVSTEIRDLGIFFHAVKPLDEEELGQALRDAFSSLQ
jgi:response regulator of citrate/malate metabolism